MKRVRHRDDVRAGGQKFRREQRVFARRSRTLVPQNGARRNAPTFEQLALNDRLGRRECADASGANDARRQTLSPEFKSVTGSGSKQRRRLAIGPDAGAENQNRVGVARPLDAAPAFERVARDNERHERHDQNGEREEEETAAHENGWRNKPLPAFGHPPHYVERDELSISGTTELESVPHRFSSSLSTEWGGWPQAGRGQNVAVEETPLAIQEGARRGGRGFLLTLEGPNPRET
jgi:hypothetical protein